MKRLVYSPKAYVFVKADTGIYDLTPYVTDCSVTRKVNQVSSASVTFRNPNRKFTNAKGGSIFHPMDPIVIFMKRFKNRPVQVFTGYCDSTPYFQLKPTTATITASCTLKRLLYTYWDPGLPFVQQVLAQRGWNMVGAEGGLGIANLSPDDDPENDDGNDNGDNTNENNNDVSEITDGSIGALLFDILVYIGNWDPSTIFIEPIPKNVYEVAESLIGEMNEANKDARREFNKLLKYIIGEDGYGSNEFINSEGGPVAVQIMSILVSAGFTENAAAGITGNAYQESTWNPAAIEPGSNPENGGLWGFTAGEKSLASMKAYAQSQNKPWTDVATQTNFMLSVGWGGNLKQRLNQSTLEEATELFCWEWEKPLESAANIPRRIEGARKALRAYQNNQGNGSDSGGGNGGGGNPPQPGPVDPRDPILT